MIIRESVMKILINEGRLEDAKAKYPGKEAGIDDLSKNDPSGNNKYLGWMAKMVFEQGSIPKHVMEAITYFRANNVRFEQKDINQYKTLKDLLNAIDVSKSKISKKEVREAGVEKVYEDETITVVHPKTHAASCAYGSNTRWCVTMKDEPSFFRTYSQSGPLFFFIDKRRLPNEPKLPRENYWKVALYYNLGSGVNPINKIQNMDKQSFMNAFGQFIKTTLEYRLEFFNVKDTKITLKTAIKYVPSIQRAMPKIEEYMMKQASKFYDIMDVWIRNANIETYGRQIPGMSKQLVELINLLDPDFDLKEFEKSIASRDWEGITKSKMVKQGPKPSLKWYDVELDKKMDAERRKGGKV